MEISAPYVITGLSVFGILTAGFAHHWLSGRFPTLQHFEREMQIRDAEIAKIKSESEAMEVRAVKRHTDTSATVEVIRALCE